MLRDDISARTTSGLRPRALSAGRANHLKIFVRLLRQFLADPGRNMRGGVGRALEMQLEESLELRGSEGVSGTWLANADANFCTASRSGCLPYSELPRLPRLLSDVRAQLSDSGANMRMNISSADLWVMLPKKTRMSTRPGRTNALSSRSGLLVVMMTTRPSCDPTPSSTLSSPERVQPGRIAPLPSCLSGSRLASRSDQTASMSSSSTMHCGGIS